MYAAEADLLLQKPTMVLTATVSAPTTGYTCRRFNCKDKKYHARIIAYDGIIEIHINDMFLIQNAFSTESSVKTGLFCGNGTCVIEDFGVYKSN